MYVNTSLTLAEWCRNFQLELVFAKKLNVRLITQTTEPTVASSALELKRWQNPRKLLIFHFFHLLKWHQFWCFLNLQISFQIRHRYVTHAKYSDSDCYFAHISSTTENERAWTRARAQARTMSERMCLLLNKTLHFSTYRMSCFSLLLILKYICLSVCIDAIRSHFTNRRKKNMRHSPKHQFKHQSEQCFTHSEYICKVVHSEY